MILDASFLIDLIADDDGATAKLHEIDDDERLSVPTLAYTEVGVGIDSGTTQAQQFEMVMEGLASRTTRKPHGVLWTCSTNCARRGSRSVRSM